MHPAELEKKRIRDLTILDEASFKHVGIYADLRAIVWESELSCLVPREGSALSWDRALLLNLIAWSPGLTDVLSEPTVAADVVMHMAWHHLGDRHLEGTVAGQLLAESIASAFDIYLVGRLLGHASDSDFLETQVPRMSEVALSNGLEEGAFEELLEGVAKAPERAFKDVRELLFDVSMALVDPGDPESIARRLAAFDSHPWIALLHHFEISTWVLRSRIEAARVLGQPTPKEAGRRPAFEVDALLRQADDPVAWLEKNWVLPTVGDR